MEENFNIVQEILHDLFSSLEALETQNTAILEFLKDKGIGTDEEFAPHLEQAGKASEVRWRAVRVRADYLFSSAIKAAEQAAEKESPKQPEPDRKSKPATTQSDGKETARGAQQIGNDQSPQNDKSQAEVGAGVKQNVEQGRNQPDDSNTRPRKSDAEKAA
jgi:hypothetical protein